MDLPAALIFRPVKSVIGPVGPCSPGIHLGYTSVSGPGLAGMCSVACRMRWLMSRASTLRTVESSARADEAARQLKAVRDISARLPGVLKMRMKGFGVLMEWVAPICFK